MAEKTKIEWCEYTFNPWWGCNGGNGTMGGKGGMGGGGARTAAARHHRRVSTGRFCKESKASDE